MHRQIRRSFGFLRTTAIGGLLFLLPLIVIGALLGYLYSIVSAVYVPLKEIIPVDTAAGFAALFMAAVAIVLLACFFAGLMARRAIAKKFSKTVEKQLMMVFPKYAVYKEILAGNFGDVRHAPMLRPVSVRFDDYECLAFEADRIPDGRVVIYVPGAPDSWIGSVLLVEEERVARLSIPLPEAVGIFERLGRDSAHLFGQDPPQVVATPERENPASESPPSS